MRDGGMLSEDPTQQREGTVGLTDTSINQRLFQGIQILLDY